MRQLGQKRQEQRVLVDTSYIFPFLFECLKIKHFVINTDEIKGKTSKFILNLQISYTICVNGFENILVPM